MLPPPGYTPVSVPDYATTATPTSVLIATLISSLTPSLITTSDDALFSFPTSPPPPTASLGGAMEGPHGDHGHPPPPPNGECRLLGPFALIIQAALGVLALMSLVWKRWRERPQRPLKIWFFDASKQVFGSALLHVANLLMSMLSSGQFEINNIGSPAVQRRMVDDDGNYQPNPCSFYLLNLAIDTTIGIPILVVLLRVFHGLAAKTPLGEPPESIQSGNYGHPPKATWWLKQSIIYFFGLLGMKICVLIIFVLLPWIGQVGDWALRWTEGNEKLQVFFVMLFFPVVMNAAQYYIIDSFIKKPNEHEPIPSEAGSSSYDSDSDNEVQHYVAMAVNDADSEDEESSMTKAPLQSKTVEKSGAAEKSKSSGRVEYDPENDGESASTVVASGSVNSESR